MTRLVIKKTNKPVKRYSILTRGTTEYRVMKVEPTGDLIIREVFDTKLYRITINQTDLHEKFGLYKVKE